MKILSQVLGIIVCVLIIHGEARAVKEYTWDGSESTNWVLDDNWDVDPGTGSGVRVYIVPGPGDYDDAPTISSSPSFDIDYMDINSGGQLSITGGTTDVDEDIACYSGADINISGGTCNIGDDLYLFDSGSSITCSGGTLDITGDIFLGLQHPERSDGTNGSPTLTVSGGTVNCTNLVFDDAEGDTPVLVVTAGTLNISGDLRSDGADVDITISGTGVINIGGDLEMDGGSDDLTMTGGTLTFGGDWTNTGTTNLSGGTIIADGSGAQQITNTSGETFYNFEIDNSSTGVTLNDPVTIENDITFTDGVLITTSTNVLIIEDGASTTSVSNASHVNGPVTKVGNDAMTFPVGDGSTYRPISITAPTSATDEFTAEYFSSDPDASYSTSSLETGLTNVSEVEYWILDRDNGSSNVTVTLSWNATSLVGALADLRVARWNGSQWNDEGSGGTTGNSSSGTIQSGAAISSFSPFTLGSTNLLNNPLPVELIAFNASTVESDIILQWTTATEVNNSHFTLEKLHTDFDIWEPLADIKSKSKGGNSNDPLHYEYVDYNPGDGLHYYRLKQIDFDGTVAYHNSVYATIENTQSSNHDVVIAPNPISDHTLYFDLHNSDIESFKLFDLNGKLMQLSYVKEANPINLNPSIPSGVYIAQFQSLEGHLYTRRVVIH